MEKYLYKVICRNDKGDIISSFIVESFWIALSEFAIKSKMMISNANRTTNRNMVIRTGYVPEKPNAVFMESETINKSTNESIFFVNIATIKDRGVGCGFSNETEPQYKSKGYMTAMISTATKLNNLAKGHPEVGKVIACLASKNDKSELWDKKALSEKKRKKELSCKF